MYRVRLYVYDDYLDEYFDPADVLIWTLHLIILRVRADEAQMTTNSV